MQLKGLGICLFTLLCAAATAGALSQDAKTKPQTADKAAAAEASMAKMMEFATPGAAHKVLEQRAGNWMWEAKMFTPAAPEPMTSKGTSEAKWILEGRYLQDTVEGTAMGQPFHGMGLTGYDNLKKKYVGTWVDTMGTGILHSEGTYDAATKTFTYTGETPDVEAGKYVKSRTTERMVDADHWLLQSFQPGSDGKEYMSFELRYTRQK